MIFIYIYIYIRYIHTYVHTYIHTYTYIHIHTHTYTYIHIHIHIHTYRYIYYNLFKRIRLTIWVANIRNTRLIVLGLQRLQRNLFSVCNMSYLNMGCAVSVPKWKVYSKKRENFILEGFICITSNYQSWKYILHTSMMKERVLFMHERFPNSTIQTAASQLVPISAATTSNGVSTCLCLGINMKILNHQVQSRRIYMGSTWNSTPLYVSEMDLGSIGCNFHNLCAGQMV